MTRKSIVGKFEVGGEKEKKITRNENGLLKMDWRRKGEKEG